MTNQKILTKAIEKAQANGFMPEWKFQYTENMGWTMVVRKKPSQTDKGLTANITYMQSEFDIIFSHDFAKALWGDGDNTTVKTGNIYRARKAGWKAHLLNTLEKTYE